MASFSQHFPSDSMKRAEHEGPKSFFFCIPLKPKSRCADWDRTVMLLGQTLRSILNQTDPEFLVFIAGHDRPDLPELNDPRVSFHQVSFAEPGDGREGKRDQTRKTRFLGAIVKEHGGGYVMVVDSDDLVHKEIVRYVRSDDNRAGYMIRAGYVLDVSSGAFGKFSGNPPRQFFNHCGTSSIIYLLPQDLPDRTPDKTDIVDGSSFIESVRGHGSWEMRLLERDVFPATLPFRGSVYRLNTGDNASYTYRRGPRTISRLTSYTVDHAVPLSILEKDFGQARKESPNSRLQSDEAAEAEPKIGGSASSAIDVIAGTLRKLTISRVEKRPPAEQESEKRYTGRFYSERRDRTLHSARRILTIVTEHFPVKSVVDIGCGTGTWLDVASSLGAEKVKGFEGHWLDMEQRDGAHIDIERTNLEDPIREDKKYDLAICLEVAEHLSKARAESFVEDLCRLSDRILFGAAIPGQGGRGHVNEQWQTYWAELFSQHDYVPLDIVRPKIWHDERIRYWYRQNTLLYCRRQALGEITAPTGLPALDVVHPRLMKRLRKKHAKTLKDLRAGSSA